MKYVTKYVRCPWYRASVVFHALVAGFSPLFSEPKRGSTTRTVPHPVGLLGLAEGNVLKISLMCTRLFIHFL